MKRFMMVLLMLGVVSLAAAPVMAKGGHGHHGHHGKRGHNSYRGHHGHRGHGYYPNHFRTHTSYYRTRGYGYYPRPSCYTYPAYGQSVGYRGNNVSFWFGF